MKNKTKNKYHENKKLDTVSFMLCLSIAIVMIISAFFVLVEARAIKAEMLDERAQSTQVSKIPIKLDLVFIDGYMFFYDLNNNNVLYYYDENGILIPQYNDDGTPKTIQFSEGE